MSRPIRILYPNAWYYVTNKGRREEDIFEDRDDYRRFVGLLQESTIMWNVRIVAYCLMPNTYQILVQTPNANLSRFMRHIDGVYTQRFNRAHGYDGTLFRGRYKAILVEAETYLLEIVRYIHRTPLREGLVSRLDRYPWCSHEDYISRSPEQSLLHKVVVLSRLGKAKRTQKAGYRKYVSRPESKEIVALLSGKRIPPVLGSREFLDWVKETFRNSPGTETILPGELPTPSIEMIKKAVCSAYGVDEDELQISTRGVDNEPRNVAIYLSRRLSGATLMSIGQAFGLENYSSVSSVVRRMTRSMKTKNKLRQWVERLEKRIRMSH
jgi:putative transposase